MKGAGARFWPQTQSIAQVERSVGLHVFFFGPSWPVLRWTSPLTLSLQLNQARHQSEAAERLTQAVKTVNSKTQRLISQVSSVIIVTRLRLDRSSFRGRSTRFSCVQTVYEIHGAFYSVGKGANSLHLKRPGRETNN